jgi:hypothetical protein
MASQAPRTVSSRECMAAEYLDADKATTPLGGTKLATAVRNGSRPQRCDSRPRDPEGGSTPPLRASKATSVAHSLDEPEQRPGRTRRSATPLRLRSSSPHQPARRAVGPQRSLSRTRPGPAPRAVLRLPLGRRESGASGLGYAQGRKSRQGQSLYGPGAQHCARLSGLDRDISGVQARCREAITSISPCSSLHYKFDRQPWCRR